MSQDIHASSLDADAVSAMAPRPQRLRVLAVLSALMGFASISTDLYLPAMPTMARDLGADAGSMELTISGFLIGFSLGQLLWGPLGDRFGRRLPVAFGLLLFVIGSAGCAMSDSAMHLIVWRVVQAVGACSGVVLSRAMVRDLYEGPRAAQMLSTLITVMAAAPLLGPIVGAQVLAFAGWRAIFWLLVAVGIATLVALFTIPETLPEDRRRKISLLSAVLDYGSLLVDRRLIGFAAAGSCFYAGAYAYVAGTPFVFIDYYGVPSQFYGVLFALGIIGVMLANTVNARLAPRFGSRRLLKLGAMGVAGCGVVLCITGISGWGGMAGLAIPLFIFFSWSGLIVANSISGALQSFPERAGAASALVGALHYGSGIFGSAAVSALADGTPVPLALVVAVSSFACLASLLLLPKRQT